jgi:putative endonuclease
MTRILPQFPRLTNAQKGWVAEKLAYAYFACRGYRVLRQSGLHLAQTDLLLQKGRAVILLEVKYRSTLPAARQAMGPAQQQRLARQARLVSKRFPTYTLRLDTFALAPVWPFVRHQTNAASLT